MKPTPCPKCGAAVFIIEDELSGSARELILDAKPIKTVLQVGEHVATGAPVYPDHRVTCGRVK